MSETNFTNCFLQCVSGKQIGFKFVSLLLLSLKVVFSPNISFVQMKCLIVCVEHVHEVCWLMWSWQMRNVGCFLFADQLCWRLTLNQLLKPQLQVVKLKYMSDKTRRCMLRHFTFEKRQSVMVDLQSSVWCQNLCSCGCFTDIKTEEGLSHSPGQTGLLGYSNFSSTPPSQSLYGYSHTHG